MTLLNKLVLILLLVLSFNTFGTEVKYSLSYDSSGCEIDAKNDMEFYIGKLRDKLASRGVLLIEKNNSECSIKLLKESKIDGVLTDIDLLLLLDKFMES